MAKTLGNKIQEFRKLRKMTQEELAEKLGVTVIDEATFLEMIKG